VAETPQVQAWLDYYAKNNVVGDAATQLAYARYNASQGNAVPTSTPPTTTTPTTPGTSATTLTSDQKSAFDLLKDTFTQYGLNVPDSSGQSLIDIINGYIQQGYTDADTVNLKLKETSQYKNRFAGNEALRAAGQNVLSEGQYIATEDQMRQNLRQYGITSDQFMSQSYLAKIIGAGVSANEVNDRAKAASDFVSSTPQSVRDQYLKLYGVDSGHLTEAFLDPKVAEPVINNQIRKATVLGAAQDQGLGNKVSGSLAQEIGNVNPNVSYAQAASGFAQASENAQRGDTLSKIYGGDPYGIEQAASEQFNTAGAAAATARKKMLASQERASFSGTSGIRAGSLAQDQKALY